MSDLDEKIWEVKATHNEQKGKRVASKMILEEKKDVLSSLDDQILNFLCTREETLDDAIGKETGDGGRFKAKIC